MHAPRFLIATFSLLFSFFTNRKQSNQLPYSHHIFVKRTPCFSAFRDPSPQATITAPRGSITVRQRAASDKTVHITTDTLAAGDRNLSPPTRVHFDAASASNFYCTAGTASLYRGGLQVHNKTRQSWCLTADRRGNEKQKQPPYGDSDISRRQSDDRPLNLPSLRATKDSVP